MKFLIAGFGSIGRRHFNNLRALGQKDILFYRSGKSQLPDAELDGYIVETDLDTALAHKPDAVIVANPTALHLDVAIPAAERGCHILLEKPIGHSLERVADLHAAAESSGSRILVGFQFRFHPTLQTAAELLATGALGRVINAHAHWGEYLPDWHPYEDYRAGYSARVDLGGGVVLTLSHPFDYLRWLLGEASAVWASLGHSDELDIPVEDVADIGLQFASGAQASVHLDYLQQPPSHRLDIACTHGRLGWDALTGILRQADASGMEKEYTLEPGFERNDLFLAQTRHFLEVVDGKTTPLCTLQDGESALRIALAAHRADREERQIALD